MKILIICLVLLLSGCSREAELMTEDWRLGKDSYRRPANSYTARNYIICKNCGWYKYIWIKKGIARKALDFTDFACPRCEVKGSIKD